jgi:hypothetical protein
MEALKTLNTTMALKEEEEEGFMVVCVGSAMTGTPEAVRAIKRPTAHNIPVSLVVAAAATEVGLLTESRSMVRTSTDIGRTVRTELLSVRVATSMVTATTTPAAMVVEIMTCIQPVRSTLCL